jgi:CHAD domain-containing protein
MQDWSEEGYRQMNSGSPGSNEPSVVLEEAKGLNLIEAWRQLLARCGRKATRKRVHGLRVVTLRLQAEIEHRITEKGLDSHQVAKRWDKQAEKLRQALGPVREADVWLGKLAGLRATLAKNEGYSPRSTGECMRQIEELEDKLGQKRKTWEKKLLAEIDNRKDRIEKLSKRLELDSTPLIGKCNPGGGRQIIEQFAAIVAEFPSLNEDNLHTFRKSIKTVRYVADIFAASDPEARRHAAQLKKMQSAIGEWHDWQDLAKEQRHAHKKHDELAELLEALTAESLDKALEICERVTAQLLNPRGRDAAVYPQEGAQKRPIRSEDAATAAANEMLA